MRDVLRFQMNVPETLALAFDEGKSVQGTYGDQIYYTLMDGRATYVPPIVDAKRKELGIRKGEEFIVCKREHRDGNRKAVHWDVEVAETEAPDSTPEVATPSVQRRSCELPQSTLAPAPRPQTKLEDALINVVAAIHATRSYAKEIGFEMPVFSAEDLRCMANTLMVEGRNGGAR